MTGTIPAFLLLLGEYDTNTGYALIVALAAALSLGAAWVLGHGAVPAEKTPAEKSAEPAQSIPNARSTQSV